MSDDLVKRLKKLWDTDRSIISQTDGWMKERREAAARIEELEAQRDEAMTEAVNLARILHRNHYSDGPQWEPLDYPAGVISQIDNMVAGIVARAERADAVNKAQQLFNLYAVEVFTYGATAARLQNLENAWVNLHTQAELAELKGQT